MAVMMALGKFRFSVETAAYQKLQRVAEYDWALVERLGRRPALQFMGPGKEGVTLSGTIYPHYRGGIGQIDVMRKLAGLGEPLQLVDGLGRAWGRWCITKVDEAQADFLADGVPRRMDFTLELAFYGEDAPAKAAASPATDSGSSSTASPATQRARSSASNSLPLPPPPPPPPPPPAPPPTVQT